MTDKTGKIPFAFLIFALLCFFTAWLINGWQVGKDYGGNLPGKTLWGPIKVESGSKPVRVTLKIDSAREQIHDFLAIEVLTGPNKVSQGHYSMYLPDVLSGGLSEDLTLPGPETYYLRLRVDKPTWAAPVVTENVALSMLKGSVSIRNLMASYAPFMLLGLFSLLIGIGLYVVQNRKENRKIVRSGRNVSRQPG